MQFLLNKAGYPFHTSAEKEIVRTIKEKVRFERESRHPFLLLMDSRIKACYVALDPDQEEDVLLSENSTRPAVLPYILPDGRKIEVRPGSYLFVSCTAPQLGSERFRAPELLFDPELVGQE